MSRYVAVAGQDLGTCQALDWCWISVRTIVVAEGDDPDAVLDRAIERLGHDDVAVCDSDNGYSRL